jgi:hypothetical protein
MDRRRIPARNPEIIWRVLQDELVLVRPASGEIRVLNAVGAVIWRSVDGKRSVEDLAAKVSDAYAVSGEQARADAAAFVEELAAEGWLSFRSAPESS